jgi:transcriptional regulator with XRE-family HTH domain
MILSVKTDQTHRPRTPFQSALGRVIAEMRNNKGLSQRDLAEKAIVNRGHLCEIEVGIANPTIGTLEKISAALDSDITVILKMALEKLG